MPEKVFEGGEKMLQKWENFVRNVNEKGCKNEEFKNSKNF